MNLNTKEIAARTVIMVSWLPLLQVYHDHLWQNFFPHSWKLSLERAHSRLYSGVFSKRPFSPKPNVAAVSILAFPFSCGEERKWQRDIHTHTRAQGENCNKLNCSGKTPAEKKAPEKKNAQWRTARFTSCFCGTPNSRDAAAAACFSQNFFICRQSKQM